MKYAISIIYTALAFILSVQWYFALQAMYFNKGEYLIIVGFAFLIFCILFIILCAISIISRGLMRSGFAAAIVFFLELGLFAIDKFLGP